MRNKSLSKYLLCLLLLFTPVISSATTLVKMNFVDVVEKSEACVTASVTGIEYIEENGNVSTYTTFEVRETAFGETAQTITVRTPGGERKIGKLKIVETTPGTPTFLTNQDYLLFLTNTADTDTYSIAGFSQGVMGIKNTASGGIVVMSTMGGMAVEKAVAVIKKQREISNPENQ